MRTSQYFNSSNTLLTFTNTGFRTIQPGDAVLLGYDGNVSAPSYKANYPVTNTSSGNSYARNQNNYNYLAGCGKVEFPNGSTTNRDFVYDQGTDSLYAVLDGIYSSTIGWQSPQFIRVSRTNGSLNNTTFCVPATGNNGNTNFVSGTSNTIYPTQPVKIYDNGGTNDIWMYAAGTVNTEWVTCNGSSGAMISTGTLVPSYPVYYNPWIKVQNGYGVAIDFNAGAGALVAFSVNSTGNTVTIGAAQTTTMLGIVAGGTGGNADLIPLGNSGTFLYFRSDVGTYGTLHVVTLNTGNLTLSVVATYALTAAQANYTGRDGTGFIFSQLNANNQIAYFQRSQGPASVLAGALTLITYSPSAHTLTIGNVVPITGPSGALVSIPTPTPAFGRIGSGAHSMYDGYNFYYVEANCHLKIPFTGAAITPQGIVAYSKAYAPIGSLGPGTAWAYAGNAAPSGTAYIPFFYSTVGSAGTVSFGSGYWCAAEESIDNTFAYGVEIGVAVTSAAKGATVTVAIKNAKLSSAIGTPGVVGSLSNNGSSIYVSPTTLYAVADFDFVYPRLPSALTGFITGGSYSNVLADQALTYSSTVSAYKTPQLNFGSAMNGIQNSSATKIQNLRQSVFTMNSINWCIEVPSTSASYMTAYSMLLSFDGIFMPQVGNACVPGSPSYTYYSGTWNAISNTYSLNPSGMWSFRNEFGCNRYDYNDNAPALLQLRYQTKD